MCTAKSKRQSGGFVQRRKQPFDARYVVSNRARRRATFAPMGEFDAPWMLCWVGVRQLPVLSAGSAPVSSNHNEVRSLAAGSPDGWISSRVQVLGGGATRASQAPMTFACK